MAFFKTSKKLGIVMMSLLLSCILSAQPMKEKRIYLVDVTASMVGEGKNSDGVMNEDIFGKVKESLAATLDHIEDKSTEIVIVPYTKKPKDAIVGTIAQKDSLISLVNGLSTFRENTNIADAWSEGVTYIDTTKINYMFLLTDGRHNTGPSEKELYKRLSDWGEQSQGHAQYAFYVMLTSNARELEICNIVDETRNLWLIESMDIDASLVWTHHTLKANVFNNKEVRVSFNSNNSKVPCDSLGITFELEDNDFYEIKDVEPVAIGDVFRFKVVEKLAKIDMPVDTTLSLKVVYNKEKFPFVFITPDIIDFDIANQGSREITVNVLNDANEPSQLESLDFGKAISHEAFRRPMKWCRNVLEPTMAVPPYKWCKPKNASAFRRLAISFNEEAVRAHSQLRLTMLDANNDIPPFSTENGDTTIVASSDEVRINYDYCVRPGTDKNVFTGKVYAISDNVDVINGISASTGMEPIADWSVDYRRRGLLLLWILWILSVLLILAIIAGLLYLLYLLLSYLIKNLSPVSEPQPKDGFAPMPDEDQSKKKKEKKEKKQRKKKDLILEYLMFKYNAASLIHVRMRRLQRIKKRVLSNKKKYEARYDQLTDEIRFRYDRLVDWEENEYVPSNLRSRLFGSGKYLPHPLEKPKNGNCYGNVRGLTAAEINKENHIRKGLRYVNKQPDFSRVAKAKVVLWGRYFYRYEADIPADLKAKGVKSVHERVIRKLAIRHLCSREKIRRVYLANLDEPVLENRHLFTIHECVDLKTIYIVPREVHTLYYHSGAIGMYKKVFLDEPYDDREKDDLAEANKTVESYCQKYLSAEYIKDKCQILIPLSDYLEDLRERDREEYDKAMLQLPAQVSKALHRLWGKNRRLPSSKGVWDNPGDRANSTFSFNPEVRLNTTNRRNWTVAETIEAYKVDLGINIDNRFKYHHHRVDLSGMAIASVKVRYEDSNLGRGGGKGVQDIAIPLFERQLASQIKAGGYKSFGDFKDCLKDGKFVRDTPLVIHEDYDGETLHLVPKIIHDSLAHYGGIATVEAVTGVKVNN